MSFNQKNTAYCRKWDRNMIENYYEELKNPFLDIVCLDLIIVIILFSLLPAFLSNDLTIIEKLILGLVYFILLEVFVYHFSSFTVMSNKITIRWLYFLKLDIPIEKIRDIKFIHEGFWGFSFALCFKKPFFLLLGYSHYLPWGYEEELGKIEEMISFFNERKSIIMKEDEMEE